MRRLTGLLAPLLLALFLSASPAAAALDATSLEAGDVVLAVEAEDLGPEPQPREAEDNAARTLAGYEDPEIQFTWAASFLLLGLVVTILVIGGALWYLLVVRPGKQQTAS